VGARGKPSASSLALVDNSSVLSIPRASPPEELTADEAAEWVAITNRMPADYFGREHYSTLVQLCRHIVAARHIAKLLTTETDMRIYLKLLAAQAAESKAIIALSRTMRMTHQANVRAERSNIPVIEQKPWE
jgi:hypothetical protein